jgi:hypothetical protein
MFDLLNFIFIVAKIRVSIHVSSLLEIVATEQQLDK